MFKDYEYGWYGFNGSHNAYWMNSPMSQKQRLNARDKKLYSKYTSALNDLNKQLPKLKGVIFIYGNYKDCA